MRFFTLLLLLALAVTSCTVSCAPIARSKASGYHVDATGHFYLMPVGPADSDSVYFDVLLSWGRDGDFSSGGAGVGLLDSQAGIIHFKADDCQFDISYDGTKWTTVDPQPSTCSSWGAQGSGVAGIEATANLMKPLTAAMTTKIKQSFNYKYAMAVFNPPSVVPFIGQWHQSAALGEPKTLSVTRDLHNADKVHIVYHTHSDQWTKSPYSCKLSGTAVLDKSTRSIVYTKDTCQLTISLSRDIGVDTEDKNGGCAMNTAICSPSVDIGHKLAALGGSMSFGPMPLPASHGALKTSSASSDTPHRRAAKSGASTAVKVDVLVDF